MKASHEQRRIRFIVLSVDLLSHRWEAVHTDICACPYLRVVLVRGSASGAARGSHVYAMHMRHGFIYA